MSSDTASQRDITSPVQETPRVTLNENQIPEKETEKIYTTESLRLTYEKKLVSFTVSSKNSQSIGKFVKTVLKNKTAEIIKLNTLHENYGLLKFTPKDSSNSYVLVGHIICSHKNCISKDKGPSAIGYDGSGVHGARLRELHSVELPDASVLNNFEHEFERALLKKLQAENEENYKAPTKVHIRKGGTKSSHALSHLDPLKTPSPNSVKSNSSNSSKSDTPNYLTPDQKGSHFSRSKGVTQAHKTRLGFKQVLFQLDTHASLRSQDSYYKTLIIRPIF